MCGVMSTALTIEISRRHLGLKLSKLMKYAVAGEIL